MTALAQALPDGQVLAWVGLAAFLGGLVRGFSGFGTALVYLPLAAMAIPPVVAVTALYVFDILGPAALLPRAWREARRGDVAWVLAGAVLATPLGLAVLAAIPAEAFRYAVSALSILAILLLLSGLRLRRPPRRALLVATGAVGGLLAGAVGLPGPPVIVLMLAAPLAAAAVRANLILYLFSMDAVLIVLASLWGLMQAQAVVLGVLCAPLIMAGSLLGQRMFDPAREQLYRRVALGLIVAAAVMSLPVLEGA